ncbi:exodeoxyribonuclease VII [Skermanella stibiiresistens SB22]|uniref:Exodeoxyribonuclease 7 large subunit n=1 Tax=Skermanella stibiiresistens SB22 TaxID=1385369 RepID=W9H965_9PROT|nr:exodeoxyribonuclease VII large subunit [Skermanella stibiiresistens]EWY40358.1 exodeoxyribonuclease VII [Skermanella stibiiresistens SB22]
MTQDQPLMDRDPAPGRPGSNLAELTVTELSRALKRTVEDQFGYVRVRGEVSQPKRHGSGHVYLRLKDETAVIESVCWRGSVSRLSVQPEEGMEVICTGKLTTYPGRSQYQLVIETMELAGEGALLKLLEERKRRLAAEGLFEASRKRPLPFLPEVIGVITSPTGAVIRDILHRLADRFPRHVLLWPVAVQGETAAAQVAAAIKGFNGIAPGGRVPRPDLIIVARGGGSLEDLMAFNEEIVVRAAAASEIPLISAVGHETDTTLIDFASDRRAPTPTAAAEMAVPVRAELIALVMDCQRRQHAATGRMILERRNWVDGFARGLGDPQALLEDSVRRLDDRVERMGIAVAGVLERRRTRVAEQGAKLRHPREVMTLADGRLRSEARALGAALRQVVAAEQGRLGRLTPRLTLLPIRIKVGDGERRLGELGERMDAGFSRLLGERETRLKSGAALLESFSYRGILERGFALVTDDAERRITSAADAKPGLPVTLEFQDGKVDAVVGGGGLVRKAETAPRQPKKADATAKQDPAKQGLLF